MKRDKITPLIGILTLILVIVFWGSAGKSAKEQHQAKETIVQKCVAIAEEYAPGQNAYEWDKSRDTFTVFLWDDLYNPVNFFAESRKEDMQEKWDGLVDSLNRLRASMQIKFGDAGYGTTVSVCAVSPEDHDRVYIMVSRNGVLYDAVRDFMTNSDARIAPSNTDSVSSAPTKSTPTPDPATAHMTLSQKNAYKSAQSYLRYSGFSRERLIKQLEYEKYSTADATAAVDALVVDWDQEAAECAASYMKTSSFSRDKLYDQLIYEGFTPSQAEYGVQSVGY